jgi:hypothetical protein
MQTSCRPCGNTVCSGAGLSTGWQTESDFSELRFDGEGFVQSLHRQHLKLGREAPRARFLGRERGNQFWQTYDIEDPPEIVGERGQAELGANLLNPRTRNAPWFIHCLIVPNGCSTVSRRWSRECLVAALCGPAFDPIRPRSRDGIRSGIDCPCIATGSGSLGRPWLLR